MGSSKKVVSIPGTSKGVPTRPHSSPSRKGKSGHPKREHRAGRATGGGAGPAPDGSSTALHLADNMAHFSAALTRLAKDHPDLCTSKRPLLLRRAIRLLDRLRDDLESERPGGRSLQWVSFAVAPMFAAAIEDNLFWTGVAIGSRNRTEQLLAALATSTAANEYSPASGVGLFQQIAKVFGPDALPPKHRSRLEKPTPSPLPWASGPAPVAPGLGIPSPVAYQTLTSADGGGAQGDERDPDSAPSPTGS